MDQSTQETSDMDTSSDEEQVAWQEYEAPDDGVREDAYEEYIKEVIDEWLTKHGESLFKLQSSKFIAKHGDARQVRRTCSLKTPSKPPRDQSTTKRRIDQDCEIVSPFVPQQYTAAEYKKVLDFNKNK